MLAFGCGGQLEAYPDIMNTTVFLANYFNNHTDYSLSKSKPTE
jgi:hypothetical protein